MKLTKAQQEVVDICRAHEDHELKYDSVSDLWRLIWTDGNYRPTQSVNRRTAKKLIDAGYFVEFLRAGHKAQYRLKEGE